MSSLLQELERHHMYMSVVAEQAIDNLTAFKYLPAGWKRSRRGNLWRQLENLTLSIFARGPAWFGFSIADEDKVYYSPESYRTEGEAYTALLAELGIPSNTL